jgi:hypothetical protein
MDVERLVSTFDSRTLLGRIRIRSEVASLFDSFGLGRVAPRRLQIASLHLWHLLVFLEFVFVQSIPQLVRL